MTKAEVKAMIGQFNIPFAYNHFAEGEVPSLPYCIFRYPRSSNFAADCKAFQKAEDLDIELYTAEKDPVVEASIESILDNNNLFYQKSETFIESENMFEILYEMEMVILG